MTFAGSRSLRIVSALTLALLAAPLPGVAAGGGGHGGGLGGGMGGGRGFGGGGVFVHGGGAAARPGPGAFGGARPGGVDAAREAVPSPEGSFGRQQAGTRAAVGGRTSVGGRIPRGGRARGPFARRSRMGLRRLFARELRLRTSRCDRNLYERYHAPFDCNSSQVYGRAR